MIQVMCKVQLVGIKDLLDEVIKALHEIGVVHIESMPAQISPEESYFRRIPVEGEKAILRERFEKLLERLKGIYLLLPVSVGAGDGRMMLAEMTSASFLDEVDHLEREVRGLHAERAGLLEEVSSLERYEKILKGLAPLLFRLRGLRPYEIMGITIERAKKEIIPLLENEVMRITEGKYQLFFRDIGEEITGVILTYPREYEPAIKRLISVEAISELKLPQKYAEMTFFDALKVMIKRRGEIPLQLTAIENRLKELSEMWHRRLERGMRLLRDTIDELNVLSYCGHTRFTFVIYGWIPEVDFPLLSDALRNSFGDKVILQKVEIREDEIPLIPVSIKNPRILRPFETFLSVLPPPKYGTVDPTPYLALFFPTFFGLILGDSGYGGVLFALSLYLKRRFKEKEHLSNLASILAVSSLFAIVFGILFGEFFGDLGERLGLFHPLIFDRVKAMKVFLLLALGIGLGHITFGLILAIANYIHRGKGREALSKGSHLTFIIAFIAILAILAGYLPEGLLTPGIFTMLAALIILIVFEGVIGPVEILKSIGNILSYARIMAVGTASVMLALIANKLGGLADNVILGIVIAGIIHTINLLLGILGPAIHSLRLHYVEFFSKFYQPGGKRYAPFRKG